MIQLTPSAKTFEIVRAMFRQACDTRLAQAREMAVTLRSDIVRLDKQIEQLVDRVVEAPNTDDYGV